MVLARQEGGLDEFFKETRERLTLQVKEGELDADVVSRFFSFQLYPAGFQAAGRLSQTG